jgi:hypothetical protein
MNLPISAGWTNPPLLGSFGFINIIIPPKQGGLRSGLKGFFRSGSF